MEKSSNTGHWIFIIIYSFNNSNISLTLSLLKVYFWIKNNEPFRLENSLNLTYQFLWQFLLNFLVKIVIKKLMWQVWIIFKTKWLIFIQKDSLRNECINEQRNLKSWRSHQNILIYLRHLSVTLLLSDNK